MIIVLGMAGAGKSTQCKMLSQDGSHRWVSTSDLLRAHETPVIKDYIAKGIMVPQEVVMPLIIKDLQQNSDNPEVLLDGFPRTIEQARGFIDQKELLPRIVVHLKVSEHLATERLSIRQRADDTPQAVHRRFQDYYKDIDAILSLFTKAGVKVEHINADLSAEEVTIALKKAVEKK